MTDSDLKWTIERTKNLLHTPVYDVIEQHEVAANGIEGDYLAMDAPEWVTVIPVYRDSFVMVRQWRHASGRLTIEFPGGVAERGEDPAVSAARELLEETGFMAGRLTHLGTCNPNPALNKNNLHVFLAEDLVPTGEQHLDDDELLTCQLIEIGEVIGSFGKDAFSHAFTGTALAYYWQHCRETQQGE